MKWPDEWTRDPDRPKGPDHNGITLDTLRQLDEMVGQSVEVVEPGELLEDADGNPLGMTPNVVTSTVMCSPLVSLTVFRNLGADPEDYPNLTVYDPQEDQ